MIPRGDLFVRPLLVLALASGILALTSFTGLAQTIGPIVRVSPAGHAVAEVSAATSPVNPNFMVASSIDSDVGGQTLVTQIRCAMYMSRDAGASWSEVAAWPRTDQLKPLYDPWVTIGTDGTIHATCIADVNGVGQVAYTKSTDQGMTWSTPTLVTPVVTTAGADKSVVAAGPDGSVYVCYRRSNLMFSRSTDQGATWTTHATGVNAHCNGIVADSDGAITIATIHGQSSFNRYGTITSTNHGATWSVIRTLGDIGGAFPNAHLPTIARDHTGRTVIAGTDGTNIDISIENSSGALIQQWQQRRPPSDNCGSGRIIHPSVNAAPDRLPALQITCKIRPTRHTTGYQEVWLYPVVDQSANPSTPVRTSAIALPRLNQTPDPSSFAGRFPDGGYFWSLTWRSGGWQSMWIDPRTGNGPGELQTVAVIN